MKKLVLSLLVIAAISLNSLFAQDTLPKFSVINAGNNRIIIGWTNMFQTIKQISIQRSFDSLSGYKTILTVPDPTTLQNGFVDSKATNDHMFYRLYIMLDKGIYLFSAAKRPFRDTTRITTNSISGVLPGDSVGRNPLTGNYNDRMTRINGNDSVSVPNFGLSNKGKPEVFTPSLHVYTFKDGYVRINLPDDENKKYAIKFYDSENVFLFELKDIKERSFKIDKSNFYHAGWFNFELFEDGKLKEKHKFFLQKEF